MACVWSSGSYRNIRHSAPVQYASGYSEKSLGVDADLLPGVRLASRAVDACAVNALGMSGISEKTGIFWHIRYFVHFDHFAHNGHSRNIAH